MFGHSIIYSRDEKLNMPKWEKYCSHVYATPYLLNNLQKQNRMTVRYFEDRTYISMFPQPMEAKHVEDPDSMDNVKSDSCPNDVDVNDNPDLRWIKDTFYSVETTLYALKTPDHVRFNNLDYIRKLMYPIVSGPVNEVYEQLYVKELGRLYEYLTDAVYTNYDPVNMYGNVVCDALFKQESERINGLSLMDQCEDIRFIQQKYLEGRSSNCREEGIKHFRRMRTSIRNSLYSFHSWYTSESFNYLSLDEEIPNKEIIEKNGLTLKLVDNWKVLAPIYFASKVDTTRCYVKSGIVKSVRDYRAISSLRCNSGYTRNSFARVPVDDCLDTNI